MRKRDFTADVIKNGTLHREINLVKIIRGLSDLEPVKNFLGVSKTKLLRICP